MEGGRGAAVRPAPAGTHQPRAGVDSQQPSQGRTLGSGGRMSAHKDKRKEYLTVKDLQRVLDSCKLKLNEVDEVWPKIYIGNV